MVEVARLCLFAAFLVLGFRAAIQNESGRRQAINVFLIYTLTVSLMIGFFQLDAWPFSTYRLANQTWTGTSNRIHSKVSFFAVDSSGKEWEVDPSAWAPLYPVVLQFYFRDVFPRLTAGERRQVGLFLTTRAEANRKALRDSRYVGNERLLGPIAAPDWALYARYRDVPEREWIGIRVYREFWRPAERIRDPRRFERSLELEYGL